MKNKRVIEFIVVVVILCLLLMVSVPRFFRAQVRASLAQAAIDLKTINKALHAYFAEYKDIPPDFDGSPAKISILINHKGPNTEMWSYRLLTTPIAYLEEIPVDVYLQDLEASGRKWKKDHLLYGYSDSIKDWNRMLYPNGGLWTISSVGPDLDEDWAWGCADPKHCPYIFDISNGIKSNGDIYASNLYDLFDY